METVGSATLVSGQSFKPLAVAPFPLRQQYHSLLQLQEEVSEHLGGTPSKDEIVLAYERNGTLLELEEDVGSLGGKKELFVFNKKVWSDLSAIVTIADTNKRREHAQKLDSAAATEEDKDFLCKKVSGFLPEKLFCGKGPEMNPDSDAEVVLTWSADGNGYQATPEVLAATVPDVLWTDAAALHNRLPQTAGELRGLADWVGTLGNGDAVVLAPHLLQLIRNGDNGTASTNLALVCLFRLVNKKEALPFSQEQWTDALPGLAARVDIAHPQTCVLVCTLLRLVFVAAAPLRAAARADQGLLDALIATLAAEGPIMAHAEATVRGLAASTLGRIFTETNVADIGLGVLEGVARKLIEKDGTLRWPRRLLRKSPREALSALHLLLCLLHPSFDTKCPSLSAFRSLCFPLGGLVSVIHSYAMHKHAKDLKKASLRFLNLLWQYSYTGAEQIRWNGFSKVLASNLASLHATVTPPIAAGLTVEDCALLAGQNCAPSFQNVPEGWEVPRTKFGVRSNCQVKLYQDACGNDGEGFFTDVVKSMNAAQKFICITGWDLNPMMVLDRSLGIILKNLLIEKANAGVRVSIMIWSDAQIKIGKRLGVMLKQSTQDIKAHHSAWEGIPNVTCITQSPDDKFWWSHHQKSIICDVPPNALRGALVAFVGGIDLARGRFDIPMHPVVPWADALFVGDWYTPEMREDAKGDVLVCMQRQPWHDIHSRVLGRAAYDVLCNFQDRWNHLTEADQRLELVRDVETSGEALDSNGNFHVQVFRSIASSSFQTRTKIDRFVERDIRRAYIRAIWRAQHCIYIENQYWVSSSPFWVDVDDSNAPNKVAVQLALKCADMIKRGQDLSVMVILPMYPEGDWQGTGAKFQRKILHNQYRTIQLMYRIIGKALTKWPRLGRSAGSYLRFYCLGKVSNRGEYRNQIYVHSKLMIVDDTYCIVGSANINERSLAGDRDSELCMGLWSDSANDVAELRKDLVAEHLGIDRAQVVQELGAENLTVASCEAMWNKAVVNWNAFVESRPTTVHLLPYPIRHSPSGVTVPMMFPTANGEWESSQGEELDELLKKADDGFKFTY